MLYSYVFGKNLLVVFLNSVKVVSINFFFKELVPKTLYLKWEISTINPYQYIPGFMPLCL